MNEKFLKYIWKFKLLKFPLFLKNGKPVEIINPGTENQNAGPDFINAIIKIDDTVWAGNVEIHIKSSDWDKHRHNYDHAYDNVILHIVYHDDKIVYNASAIEIQNFNILNFLPDNVYNNYLKFRKSSTWIACAENLPDINNIIIKNCLARLVVERYERKTYQFFTETEGLKNDWETIFYRFLAKSFGFGVNSDSFYQLACITPLKIIARECSSTDNIEALLFGQSGLLPQNNLDEYTEKLYKDYNNLALKYNLKPMNKHEWKLLRIRPSGFPTIRISQLSQLLTSYSPLFRVIIDSSINNIISLFQVNATKYWDNHFMFGKKSNRCFNKKLSIASAYLIIINAVVPVLFMYGCFKNETAVKQKALDLLYNIPAENNEIIRKWLQYGITASSSADSQALLEPKTMYCNHKKCLECSLGHYMISSN